MGVLMSPEEADGAVADNLRIEDSAAFEKTSTSCNRRYSEVMQEYLRRKHRRGGVIDGQNIKPSEVLTNQADHAGPNGCSYVRWDTPDTPWAGEPDECPQLNPVASLQRTLVVEVPCQVSEVEETHSSPLLSPYSPVSPESGAESFSTAKTHCSLSATPPPSSKTKFCTHRLTPLPPPGHTPGAERHVLPRGDSSDMVTSVCLDSCFSSGPHTSNIYKNPVITVFSTDGSARLLFKQDDKSHSDADDQRGGGLSPSTPIPRPQLHHSVQSGEGEKSNCLEIRPCESASRTFVVNPNTTTCFRGEGRPATLGEERMNDVLREDAQDSYKNLIIPQAPNFEDSILESDISHFYEEPMGELYYPHHDVGGSSYALAPTSTKHTGRESSVRQAWFPSKRRRGGPSLSHTAATARLKKLKWLQRLAWGTVIIGVLLLFVSVLVYFILDH